MSLIRDMLSTYQVLGQMLSNGGDTALNEIDKSSSPHGTNTVVWRVILDEITLVNKCQYIV